jgi:hypothetical protein
VASKVEAALHSIQPAPSDALKLLAEAASGNTGGSQAARSFLFWLAGARDPTGYEGLGGVELRRLDARHKAAALEVIRWWAGPTQSDDPLYRALRELSDRFSSGPS